MEQDKNGVRELLQESQQTVSSSFGRWSLPMESVVCSFQGGIRRGGGGGKKIRIYLSFDI